MNRVRKFKHKNLNLLMIWDGSFSFFLKDCFVMKTTTKTRKMKRSFLKTIVNDDPVLPIVNDDPSLTIGGEASELIIE